MKTTMKNNEKNEKCRFKKKTKTMNNNERHEKTMNNNAKQGKQQ
jgi:hypothetical protein